MNSISGILSIAAMVVITVLFGVIAYVKLAPIPKDSQYVGSALCVDCHTKEHTQWGDSLHAKMMRRTSDAGVVLADFSQSNPNVQFELSSAVWAIGSKWEQQYMGHDGDTEVLLPGAWHVKDDQWNTKNWDGWKVPEPLRRCHGCHTVGLNVETGEFVEPSIGCESCHGPGEWHVKTIGYGRTYSALDAPQCGQCHSRGKSKDGRYFFPVGFKPGNALEDYFDEQTPDYIQNSSQWWGNGRERKRHQEYYAWKQGGHANSLKSLTENYDGKYGEVTDDCLLCHAGEAVLAGKGSGLTMGDVEHGITCSVCHFVHGDLDKRRVDCDSCHTKGAFYHRPELNSKHVPCPQDANVGCVNCHMPLTAKTGGKLQLHTHTPGIIQPQDTTKFQVPNSCANGECHQEKTPDKLQAIYNQFYGTVASVTTTN